MIFESAVMNIDVKRAIEFEMAFSKAALIFKRADGCHEMSLHRILENPGEYQLRIAWTSLEAHMVTFPESDGYQECKKLVEEFFTKPPTVVHTESVARYF